MSHVSTVCPRRPPDQDGTVAPPNCNPSHKPPVRPPPSLHVSRVLERSPLLAAFHWGTIADHCGWHIGVAVPHSLPPPPSESAFPFSIFCGRRPLAIAATSATAAQRALHRHPNAPSSHEHVQGKRLLPPGRVLQTLGHAILQGNGRASLPPHPANAHIRLEQAWRPPLHAARSIVVHLQCNDCHDVLSSCPALAPAAPTRGRPRACNTPLPVCPFLGGMVHSPTVTEEVRDRAGEGKM